jgi:hypothetical protein
MNPMKSGEIATLPRNGVTARLGYLRNDNRCGDPSSSSRLRRTDARQYTLPRARGA